MDSTAVEVPLASAKTKKGVSSKEEIIFASEVAEEEVEEVEEIVEIIEEIEEIEEVVEEEIEETENLEESANDLRGVEHIGQQNQSSAESNIYVYGSNEEEDSQEYSAHEEDQYRKVKTSKPQPERHTYQRNKKSSVVTYDADEDWEDEENDQPSVEGRNVKNNTGKNHSVESSAGQKIHSINGKRSASIRDDGYSSSNKSNIEPVYKVAKTRSSMDFSNTQNMRNTLIMQENEIEDEEDQHEIVKSSENNLVYTVLGSKKSTSAIARSKDNVSNQMQMERLEEGTVPIEGTIYYEGDNMETVYVAQSIAEDGEQYQYEEQSIEQGEQEWEGANEATNENQEQEEEEEAEEGEAVQDQIFLHEDEDGQLYFKDESGTLQPVYLTADGNYAIAENSSDEQEVQNNTNNRQETSTAQADDPKTFDDDSFIVPELDGTVSSSNPNDPDNEDNTVTISLIISEDENGQKRTQVIIPTTDNLKCELCAKSFKTSFQLLRHNRLKHAREEDITTRNFPCDLCPKRYTDQNTLARHRKTHIGDRPFGCLECGKSFPTSTALRRHLTQHNPQSRPLPCIYCGRRFLEKSALTKHEQSHLAGDQRTHTCDVCHKTFLEAADLNMHKKNHDPDKKFDCEVCGREFNRLNNLQRHMMVHKQKQDGNQEILACDVCGITYKFMSSLTRHMVTSHMNPEKLRQQADEQRKKRENNYRRYLENRKMYETQRTGTEYSGTGSGKRSSGYRSNNDNDEDTA
ncbi:zinc finger protein 652-like isoform X2 [Venturia canescens]|uniref:zinc finger protein 652-like isoform X2 n=1 Tax=Venturia canescens TaxID=32260 RepID=UPI001C9BBF4A|nr:zinc finger protein 652-like isoform X2 [Venturia canescens]